MGIVKFACLLSAGKLSQDKRHSGSNKTHKEMQ